MNCPPRAVHHAAALTLMTVLLASCNAGPRNAGDGDIHGVAAAGSVGAHAHDNPIDAKPAPTGATAFSVYDLEARWHDQGGHPLILRDLAGRPRVIAMVYTSCAYACPRILKDMKRIEGELRTAGIDAGYVMVSIDPERDTPARLSEYARSVMLDPADWTLLAGTDDSVLELAALLGVRYRRVGEADFEHSNIITLLDGSGRIVHRQIGLNAEPDALVRAAAVL
ncbi:MAG: SCO family protein [Gemmatimonadetes bacterium]|nr:SCO family protein [Gemmatimonadota bacterium]